MWLSVGVRNRLKRENQLGQFCLRQNPKTNEMKNISHSHKHRKIIWCNSMRTHQISPCHIYMYGIRMHMYGPQLICQLRSLHSLSCCCCCFCIHCESHTMWLSNFMWSCTLYVLFIQLMVLFWNGSLFDCQTCTTSQSKEIDLNTQSIVNARIVVCCLLSLLLLLFMDSSFFLSGLFVYTTHDCSGIFHSIYMERVRTHFDDIWFCLHNCK